MTERPDLSPKERMQIERHEVPARSAVIRSMDFNEVSLGYSQALAMEEAERCLALGLAAWFWAAVMGASFRAFSRRRDPESVFLFAAAFRDIMFFHQGVFPMKRDRVKIQIKRTTPVNAEVFHSIKPQLHQFWICVRINSATVFGKK